MCAMSTIRGDCRIRSIETEISVKRFMETLGLVPGTRVHVANNRLGCILELRGSRIAIGKNVAEAIVVENERCIHNQCLFAEEIV